MTLLWIFFFPLFALDREAADLCAISLAERSAQVSPHHQISFVVVCSWVRAPDFNVVSIANINNFTRLQPLTQAMRFLACNRNGPEPSQKRI
ncbi:MAG: hypothetical protein JO170_10630 [Verrucomicrobia bacterium]|nr:hypothetical protein [Verrucomicrobiota bacterium]